LAATVMVDGTVAADVLLLVSVTEAFEVGVPFSFTVPVAVPVTRLTGLIESDWISTAEVTDRLAVFETPPKEPVIVTLLLLVWAVVVIENEAVREPAGTETLAGTDAAELFEESVTVALEAAGAFRTTVPFVFPPPFTLGTSILTASRATEGVTVSEPVFDTPP